MGVDQRSSAIERPLANLVCFSVLVVALVSCDDRPGRSVTEHMATHKAIVAALDEAYEPVPGCSLTYGGGMRQVPVVQGAVGGSGGSLPPADPDTGVWHSSLTRAFLLDASTLRVQELFRTVEFLEQPTPETAALRKIETLDDPSFETSALVGEVCRAVTEFYALRFADLNLERRHRSGVSGTTTASSTLTLTDVPWRSSQVVITAQCSRDTKRISVHISYFKHWDGRSTRQRHEFLKANGLPVD